MNKILIVDDNKQIVTILSEYAKKNSFIVDTAFDGEEAVIKAKSNNYDIILLDVMMPKKDGYDVCKEVRSFSNLPIIMITSKGEDYERILGLEIGADDYITKPFLTKELLLRIAAVLRRTYKLEEGTGLLRCGDALVDLDAGVVKHEGKEVSLTSKELALLQVLYRNRGKIVTMDALCNAVWPEGNYGLESSLIVHMRHLREKIEKDPSKPEFLTTVRGLGYKLEKNR